MFFLGFGSYAQAQAGGLFFDPNVVIPNSELNALPASFNSAAKIQDYLVRQNSMLASISVDVSLESDDPVLLSTPSIGAFAGRSIPVSQLLWSLAREGLGSSCSITDTSVCVNNATNPINPVFLLAKIQKESGLIYGRNARLDPNSDQAKWLLDRVTGYYCTDGSRERSCYDENPYWKYYKGFFRQMFYSVRLLRLVERRCDLGGSFSYPNRNYFTGNTMRFSNVIGQPADQIITFRTGMACSLYVYTPYVSAQRLFFCIWLNIAYSSSQCQDAPPAPPSSTQNQSSSVSAVEPVVAQKASPVFGLEERRIVGPAAPSTPVSVQSIAAAQSSQASSQVLLVVRQNPLPSQNGEFNSQNYTSLILGLLAKSKNIQ